MSEHRESCNKLCEDSGLKLLMAVRIRTEVTDCFSAMITVFSPLIEENKGNM